MPLSTVANVFKWCLLHDCDKTCESQDWKAETKWPTCLDLPVHIDKCHLLIANFGQFSNWQMHFASEVRASGVIVPREILPSKQCRVAINKRRELLTTRLCNHRRSLCIYTKGNYIAFKYFMHLWTSGCCKYRDCTQKVRSLASRMLARWREKGYVQGLHEMSLLKEVHEKQKGLNKSSDCGGHNRSLQTRIESPVFHERGCAPLDQSARECCSLLFSGSFKTGSRPMLH